MNVMSSLRSAVPPGVRATLRRSTVVNRFLQWRYGGDRVKPHPYSPYRFHFDGMKNIGWAIGSLAEFEKVDITYALNVVAERRCVCVWDVGANLGFWSLAFAAIPGVREVVAFEPDAANLRLLRKNRDANQLKDLLVREVGLSSRAGQAEFFADPLSGTTGSLEKDMDFIGKYYGAARQTVRIELSTIDAEVAGGRTPPEFLKIDVEGHELDVLTGGRETLTRHRPPLIMEVTSRADEVGDLLRSYGYRLLRPDTGEAITRPTFSTVALPE